MSDNDKKDLRYTTGLRDATGALIPDEAFENDIPWPGPLTRYSDDFLKQIDDMIAKNKAEADKIREAEEDAMRWVEVRPNCWRLATE